MYIHINSEYLQLAEPLMTKYYDFHSSMLYDEIRQCVENSGIDYKKRINGMLTIDFDQSFKENKDLTIVTEIPYKQSISEVFSSYFTILEDDSTEEETVTDDDIVYICLTFMSYIYYKV